jgi:hypothetical protein
MPRPRISSDEQNSAVSCPVTRLKDIESAEKAVSDRSALSAISRAQ